MTPVNSNSPIARREALSDPIEQLRRMMEIRFVEERIQKLFSEGHVRGSTHLASGQEAVAVGIARSIDVDQSSSPARSTRSWARTAPASPP